MGFGVSCACCAERLTHFRAKGLTPLLVSGCLSWHMSSPFLDQLFREWFPLFLAELISFIPSCNTLTAATATMRITGERGRSGGHASSTRIPRKAKRNGEMALVAGASGSRPVSDGAGGGGNLTSLQNPRAGGKL